MPDVSIPHEYEPRDYQLPVWEAFYAGTRRFLLIWHRRAGKDKTCLNILVAAACQTVGNYIHLFPSYTQGKKAIWNAVDKNGFRVINHIPPELRDGPPNNTDMFIRFWNGSTYQILGTENIDSVMGMNPRGIIVSEYALQDPRGWEFLRPILVENEGWVMFNSTPRTRHNHLYKLYRNVMNQKKWFVSLLTVDDTKAVTKEAIEEERRSGMEEELISQEFYCSFESGMSGSFYGKEMEAAEKEGRIGDVPYDVQLRVDTWWDLGVGEPTAIIFTQSQFNQIRIIDYYEATGLGLADYAKMLQEKPYVYGEHIAPHDIAVRELGTGRARIEIAAELGIRFKTARMLPVEDGIAAEIGRAHV